MPEAQVGGGHAPHERTVGAGDDLFEQRCRIAQGISLVERPGAALMVETVVDALPDGIQFFGGEQVAECDSAAGVLFVYGQGPELLHQLPLVDVLRNFSACE